jgi:hypothetical protein
MITTDQMNVNNINVGCVLVQNAKPDKSEEHLINLLINQCPVIELNDYINKLICLENRCLNSIIIM